ncbi:glycosyltransferase [Salinibacterium sp. ZJ70]|uniref:glycosyltransferase n=1 Tax=Salinibacterium sp. ZJ70 TaxID=2708084 RepID=UPI001423BF05|nr:glycosyltransferase [Salinibacterium sp. ZJ70]
MRVRHLGNTANNAFHNVCLLRRYEGIESTLPISMFGLGHGMSAPAWEVHDFAVPTAEWVSSPDWSMFPEAVAINSEYSDIAAPSVFGAELDAHIIPDRFPRAMDWVRRNLVAPMRGKRWAEPIFDLRDRQMLARRNELTEPDDHINMLYGGDSLAWVKMPRSPKRTVYLEHGTIRWSADGGADSRALRHAYRRQVKASQHLWVTNLDPRTLEIAEDLVPGRWSVLPHPFMPDERVPFATSQEARDELLAQTRSQHLVLLPSSQNWSKQHDKGSIKALNAFVELRKRGIDVGLVAVEWGLQLAESKEFLAKARVGDNVAWIAPMARFGLQRMMANVDVVWDQFGLDAFGALALRAMEQGTPLVSRGLAPIGEALIGGPVPWLNATTTDDIVRQTSGVLEDMVARGRDTVIDETRAVYRTWLLERHSPAITAALQRELYDQLIDGSYSPGSADPGRWAALLNTSRLENG